MLIFLGDSEFYVQLLLESKTKQQSEINFRAKFPSSCIITFYDVDPCIFFLKSISEPGKIGNATVILQLDDSHVESIIDGMEQINAINHIYICSKHASDIPYRSIIHEKFDDENDLFVQLYSDNYTHSFMKANKQIEVYKNAKEANRYFQQMEQFYKLVKEHEHKETNLLE